jgi:hypothetical protein
MDDLFDVSQQQIQLIAIGPNALRRAEREIVFCEHCNPNDSEIPFDWLLTEVIGKRGPYEFILCEPARCRIAAARSSKRRLSSLHSSINRSCLVATQFEFLHQRYDFPELRALTSSR